MVTFFVQTSTAPDTRIWADVVYGARELSDTYRPSRSEIRAPITDAEQATRLASNTTQYCAALIEEDDPESGHAFVWTSHQTISTTGTRHYC